MNPEVAQILQSLTTQAKELTTSAGNFAALQTIQSMVGFTAYAAGIGATLRYIVKAVKSNKDMDAGDKVIAKSAAWTIAATLLIPAFVFFVNLPWRLYMQLNHPAEWLLLELLQK